jgi:hypothetical protein
MKCFARCGEKHNMMANQSEEEKTRAADCVLKCKEDHSEMVPKATEQLQALRTLTRNKRN